MSELKKRIYSFAKSDADDVDELLEMIDKAKKEFPMSVLVEAKEIYNDLKRHTEKEINLLYSHHLKNCNLERFTLETVDWFVKWFGESDE